MRRDIQLLRGIAVLLVVFYHADLELLGYGYLGVDVFFTVSGFLITTIILKGLNQQSFSFFDFYLRRAKRLLPALYSTLLFSTLLGFALLTHQQWQDFVWQLVGAVSFTANLVLPTQIGYFESNAAAKPLLHIWSLSLEEQYYFFLPLFLFLLPKQYRLTGLASLFFASLSWCLYWSSVPNGPAPFLWRFADATIGDWNFYLFPSRAWELLAGSLCAWVMLRKPNLHIPAVAKWTALGTILLVPIVGVDSVHPRGNALAVVLATSIVVLGDDRWLPEISLSRIVEKVGDWSYSVYLVHWPMFAFAYIYYLGDTPGYAKLCILTLSIVLGYCQYRFVETPFRHNWNTNPKTTWSALGLASIVVIAVPAFGISNTGAPAEKPLDFEQIRLVNYGLNRECDEAQSLGKLHPACQSGVKPVLAVWGDSYAMHLVPGIELKNVPFVQLTKTSCGPIPGLAQINDRYPKYWAEECIKHNNLAMQTLLESSSIKHVVMSSPFGQYFEKNDDHFLIGDVETPKQPDLAVSALASTIQKLQDAGKQVTLVSPPPKAGFNMGDCEERRYHNLWTSRRSCNFSREEYLSHDREVIDALKLVEQQVDARFLWLDSLICTPTECRTHIDDTYIYRDTGHLTISASKKLLGNYPWGL